MGITELLSSANDGQEANGDSYQVTMSENGRYVAFVSWASNLVPGDKNHATDVFVRDLKTGQVERVSVSSTGAEGNWDSGSPSISADGRFVAFASWAWNLVPGDTNQTTDGFIRDRVTGTTERVTVAADGTQVMDWSGAPIISADARYAAFLSDGSLVPGDTNGYRDVFLRDRVSGTLERISVAPDGTQADKGSDASALDITPDGRYVAYSSLASNLVPLDTNVNWDIFVWDRVTEATERVSVASDGTQADDQSTRPSLSADGRFVAFNSLATNLVPNDVGDTYDVFVHDRGTGSTERISAASNGSPADHASGDLGAPAISADGRYVAFSSFATNLDAEDNLKLQDIFVRDRLTQTTRWVSRPVAGPEGRSPLGEPLPQALRPTLSPDGRWVLFESNYRDLTEGDDNELGDVFISDTGPPKGVLEPLSVTRTATGAELFVEGSAAFWGTPFASASDPGDDADAPPQVGGEIEDVVLIHRPQAGDILLRLGLASLPEAGVRWPVCLTEPCFNSRTRVKPGGVLYRLEFTANNTSYEVQAMRTALTSNDAQQPYIDLRECQSGTCYLTRHLEGDFGGVGPELTVSIPLSAIGLSEGGTLTDVRATTAVGEAATGSLYPLDEAALPGRIVPVTSVELGIAPASAAEHDVTYGWAASISGGGFLGRIPVGSLSSGHYRVWARVCSDQDCGPAVSQAVEL